jgi:RNA polymerase sigma-70 factor (ECF subfamily)
MTKPADLVRLLLEHREGLFGFVLALTHDRDAAEEVFQEVGLAVVEEANRGAEIRSFLPWAHEIARRRVAEYFRKRSRRAESLESLDTLVGRVFEEEAADPRVNALRRKLLDECIDELPDTQREMIERRYRGDSVREIAGRMKWTDGAVKVALWKARQRLGECVDGKLGGEE